MKADAVGPTSLPGYWLLQAHIAWAGERAWAAAGERVSRYGIETGPGERAGSRALVKLDDPQRPPCQRPGCPRRTDGQPHRKLCDVCRGKTSGLGNAGRTGRIPRSKRKGCWACEGLSHRRPLTGCPVCKEPHRPEAAR